MIFRFSTPLCISVCDYFFLSRSLPSPRSWASLLALLVGAVGYGTTDSAFVVKGYEFCALWYVCRADMAPMNRGAAAAATRIFLW